MVLLGWEKIKVNRSGDSLLEIPSLSVGATCFF